MPNADLPGGRKSHWLFRLLGATGWILALGTFLLCIPTPFGPAKLGFTIVSGHSMEPTYWTNDIVVTWRTGDYAVGEPIVYTIPADEPGAGFKVVHRIVDVRKDGTFETLGDNNAEPDMWQPGPDDVKGHVFAHIPKLGLVFHPGVLPLVLAGIAGLFVSMAVFNWLSEGEESEGEDDEPPSGSGPPLPSRRHLAHGRPLAYRMRLARALRAAFRLAPPKHARPRPVWRRRVSLAIALVLFGTAGASHAATLGGIRAADMFAMTQSLTPTTPPATRTLFGTAGILEGGDSTVNVNSGAVRHGDTILNMSGAFGCSSASTFDGDLILPRGSANLSNTCRVNGDLVAYGDINIYNTTVAIGGDVISVHGNVTIEGATIQGSVKAYGGVALNNSVSIAGDVIAEGHATTARSTGESAFTGSSSSMKTIGGSVSIGGSLSHLDLVHVTGPITVTSTGSTSIGAVGGAGAVTASSIRLAGTCTDCVATPTPQQQVTGLSAPTFTEPPQLAYPTWVDYAYSSTDWANANYDVVKATACDYQNNAALVTAVNALQKNTVIDARACSNGLNLYGVQLSLHASVTLVAPSYSAQGLTVSSADGADHVFNLITPDSTADGGPSCSGGSSTITAAVLGSHISGLAYTPCTLAWGSAGSGSTQWNGQLVAGYPDFSGSAGAVSYSAIALPQG